MADFRDEERLKALRERLYARGGKGEEREAYKLKDEPQEVPTSWHKPPNSAGQQDIRTQQSHVNETPMPQSAPNVAFTPPDIDPMAQRKKKHHYRLYVLLAGIAFFLLAVGVSSLLFILGGNSISGENIAVSISGPFTVGGGEAIPLQIGITNQNTVAIESATLIVTYPQGTHSATEEGRELFVERLPIESIQPGEALNIPLRAIVFGEENEEKIINAEVEYRVTGSNSTFAKEAEPLRFKIGSSPVVLTVDTLHKVSSGQESEVTLKISSNSPSPLTNLIVRAEYPNGFDFTKSDPAPVSGQNVWHIDTLSPEGDTSITIKGIVVGKEDDVYAMHFSIGVPNNQDQLSLSSVFSSASTEFEIEQPFIDVELVVNNNRTGNVAVESGERVDVRINLTNTTNDTIFDGRVELTLSGNALSDYEVTTSSGFYDSTKSTVYWDASSVDDLEEMPPGDEVSFNVTLKPDPDIEVTPQLAFDVSARARRVNEGNATEELVGTAASVAKVSSVTSLLSEVGRDTSTFSDTGPLPPVAEEETTYTITLLAQNGTNDIGDTEITASLPGYVEWLDETSGSGKITFNEVSRTVTWNVGSVDANQSKIASFQVSLLPSKSQIGTTPTLLGEQRLRATDRFTGSVVRTQTPALTTRMSEEAGYPKNIGEVQE